VCCRGFVSGGQTGDESTPGFIGNASCVDIKGVEVGKEAKGALKYGLFKTSMYQTQRYAHAKMNHKNWAK